MQGRLFAGHCAAVRSHSTACDDVTFRSQRSMLTFKNRKTLIINIHLTNQVDNACFLATRAAQTMSVLRATICCKHYRLIKLIPQHPANKRKPGVAPLRASNVCDDGNFSSPKECALAPAPDRMLAYGGMSKGRL